MKFSCEKNLLQSACNTAARAAASKSPIPALEGLLIRAEDKITITGYDLKEGIYTAIEEADVQETGAVVVNARFFGEMMRRLPDGIVKIEADINDNINVKCGKSEFHFIGISAKDYPDMPSVDEVNNICLPQKILASMINQTIFAVATNDVRPIYTGTLFEVGEEELTLVAVDGYRLAKRTEKIEGGRLQECSFVVPGSALTDVERICSDEGDVEISVGAKHISFVIGTTVVVSRRLEGEFLNYRKSIPTSFKYEIKIDRGEFMAAIDRVSLIVNEKNVSPVRITFNDNYIGCLCVTPVGRAEDICTCEGTGEGLETGFNDRYMKDALKAAAKDELILCVNGASSPCIVKAADGTENFTYMILPVRLRAGS